VSMIKVTNKDWDSSRISHGHKVSRGRWVTKGMRTILAIAALAVAVAGCSRDKINYFEADVSVLYGKAREFMDAGQYRFAAVTFDEIERQHPYSLWARRATLMAAYNHYLSNDYDTAILSAQRFLALHPGNEHAPYAYYMIASCFYEQIADVNRDQMLTEQALRAFSELVRRYPDSEYASDARLKIGLAQDHLAGKEMTVGRFYMNAKEYLAAVNRFQIVIEKFETTSHVPEALHRLVENYLSLGVYPEAEKAAAVLGHNYPRSKWYRASYDLLTSEDLSPADG
jgi:outer membrane protein assembly factor BamD